MVQKTITLLPESLLIRNTNIFGTQVDDDLVMMDEAEGKYFGLNSIARSIWEYMENPASYESLIIHLTQLYNVDCEACSRDIEPFLKTMIDNQLINFVEV